MRIFALVSNNVVENVVVCDSQELASQLWRNVVSVDINDHTPQPGIGWSYVDGVFTPPPPPEPPPSGSTE